MWNSQLFKEFSSEILGNLQKLQCRFIVILKESWHNYTPTYVSKEGEHTPKNAAWERLTSASLKQ